MLKRYSLSQRDFRQFGYPPPLWASLSEEEDVKSLCIAAEQGGSTVGMLCLGLRLRNHFGGEGGASAPPLSLPQICILPYILVPGLILVQFTTHQEPIQLKTTLFLGFLVCSKLTFLLQLTAQPH